MLDDATLAATSAALNAVSTVLLLAGRRAARSADVELHGKLMSAAILTSALFLVAFNEDGTLKTGNLYPTPTVDGTVLAAVIANGAVSYQWKGYDVTEAIDELIMP